MVGWILFLEIWFVQHAEAVSIITILGVQQIRKMPSRLCTTGEADYVCSYMGVKLKLLSDPNDTNT